MTNLPEKIRVLLDKVVKEMRTRENIESVGLFGSWSRGEATEASDVDILLINNTSLIYEFVERIELKGFLVDLDYLPKIQLQKGTPPILDQKIYEVQILYDKQGSLTDRNQWMTQHYRSMERVELRTQKQVVDSDVHLSRATSALARKDFPSAYLFATMAWDSIMRILMEITLEPFSPSRFIQKIQRSATKLEKQNLIPVYLKVTGLDEIEHTDVTAKINLFTEIWHSLKENIVEKKKVLESAHFKEKTKINYYLTPAFLEGIVTRTKSILHSGELIEAAHYLNRVFIDMIKSYVWIKSVLPGVEIDPTTLIKSLKRLEHKTPKNYTDVLQLLNLHPLDKSVATNTIEKAKDTLIKTRKQRKTLIRNHLIKS
ncbi:MAG: nucleotidyltransferase family protein [Thermoproteota archaeon]